MRETPSPDRLTFIPASEVPSVGRTDWDSIFSSLPEGKAYVFTKGETVKTLDTVRSALNRKHAVGKFLELTCHQLQDKLYVYRSRLRDGE